MSATFLVVDPAHYDVSYTINPWMRPGVWRSDPQGLRRAACEASRDLTTALTSAGAQVVTAPGVQGAPDLVFPANAAVVLDRRAVLGRFRHGERQGEEAINLALFERLRARGLIDGFEQLPRGVFQEGAGDYIWDGFRGLFWAGYGQRSDLAGARAVAAHFGKPSIELRLATERFYHLDTCFCPLSGGEILYYPAAFGPEALGALRAAVPADLLIEATSADAERFCVNAVCVGKTIVMAKAAEPLKAVLADRGYRVHDVNLAPFILSGGGAYCMTLRLDLSSEPLIPLTNPPPGSAKRTIAVVA